MAEELTFISGSKEEQYLSLLPQVKALIEGEEDLVANLAKGSFRFFLGRFLFGEAGPAGIGTVSGTGGLYAHSKR